MVDLFWVVLIIVLLIVAFISVSSGSNSDKTTTMLPNPRMPRTLKRVPPARRKRLSGGYYPAGYTGSYYPGEDMVDGLIVLAMIDAMTDQERLDCGEGDYYSEWQETDTGEVVEESSYEVAAEAEEYTAIDDDTRTTWGGDDSDSGGLVADDSDSFGGFDD